MVDNYSLGICWFIMARHLYSVKDTHKWDLWNSYNTFLLMYIKILLRTSIWLVAGWAQWEATTVMPSCFPLSDSWFQFYLSVVIFFSSETTSVYSLNLKEILEKILRRIEESTWTVLFFFLSQTSSVGDFLFKTISEMWKDMINIKFSNELNIILFLGWTDL